MAHRTRTKKKPPPTPEPPPPASITVEGFGPYQTPDPGGSFFSVPTGGPCVHNCYVSIHRYRTTVERIEETREVLVERLYTLWERTRNWHEREALEGYAHRRFQVSLCKMREERRAATQAPPPPDTPADPGSAPHSSVNR